MATKATQLRGGGLEFSGSYGEAGITTQEDTSAVLYVNDSGQLVYHWAPTVGGGSAVVISDSDGTSVGDLTDVTITGAAAGELLIYNGSAWVDLALSGDATLASDGALTIAANAVEGSMLNDNAISGQTAMTGDLEDTDELLVSDGGTLKKADFSVVRDAVFADVSGDATIAAGGALTIAADAVESGMLNDNVISGQTELAHADIADADEMMISDGGVLKKVGVDSLRDHYFGVISGDATVADGGALTIANDAVDQDQIADDAVGNDQLANMTRGTVKVGGASNAPTDLDAKTSGYILVGDGTDIASVAVSGDVTLAANGAVTIAADAVESGMLNDNVISGQTELAQASIVDDDELMISDGGVLKKVGVDSLGNHYYGNVSGDATIADGGALTIAAGAVTYAMLDSAAIKDEDDMASNSASHLATQQSIKAYVDSVAQGLQVRPAVRVATTGDITLSGAQTIDGVSVVAGDRVLVKDQSTASENGIYVAAAGAWSRAADMAAGDEARAHFVFVEEGTANADNGFVCTSDDGSDVVGTNNLAFAQFSGAGQITAGAALTKTGNQLDVAVDDSSIEISSDALQVKASGITNDMLAGSIANAKLSNTTIEVQVGDGITGGGAGTLGSTAPAVALDLNGLTAAAVSVANDSIAIIDADDANGNKKESIADLMTAVAGTGLTATNGVLSVNAAGASAGVIDVAADSFQFIDANDADATKKESIADLMTAVAGDGLAASSGVLAVGVDDSSVEINSDALRVKEGGITNAMLAGSIADSKLNTISTAGKVDLAALEIDGGTDIGADLADADLFIVDDGAGGTNRKCEMSRIKTYVSSLDALTVTRDLTGSDGIDLNEKDLINGGDINCDSVSIDDAAEGLNIDFTGAGSGLSKITVSDGEKASAFALVSGAVNLMNLNTQQTPAPMMTNLMNAFYSGSSTMIGNWGLAVNRRVNFGGDEQAQNPHAYMYAASGSGASLYLVASGSSRSIGGGNFAETVDSSGNSSITANQFTVTSDAATFTSANSRKPVFAVKNTNADANGALLVLQKDSDSPAASDELGQLIFKGDDDGGTETNFAVIKAVSTDVADTSEDGQLSFAVLVAGTSRAMTYDADGLTLLNDSGYGKVKAHSFVTYSDETLKTNIAPMGDALSTVNKLQGVTYDWKNDGKGDIGFIAQEVAKVVPEVVVSGKEDGLFAMDYARLTAVLVEGMKEQQRQIEDLKNVVVKLSNGKTVQAKMAKVKVPTSTELLSDATSEDAEKLLAAKYGWSDED